MEGQQARNLRAMSRSRCSATQSVGVITVIKLEVPPFSERQIELLKTFADQAVIAIENVRLFEEVQARTRELQESLEYQTATRTCSTSSAARHRTSSRCWTPSSTRRLVFVAATSRSFISCTRAVTYRGQPPATTPELADCAAIPIDPGVRHSLAALLTGRATVHVPDVTLDTDYPRSDGPWVGLLRTCWECLCCAKRPHRSYPVLVDRCQPFSQRQIALVSTFADQAVIAINNVGLFEEVQARTRDLTEALELQTATSEVLQASAGRPSILTRAGDARGIGRAALRG